MHSSHCLAHSSRSRLLVAAVVCAVTLVAVPSVISPAAASPQAPGPGPRQAFTIAQTLSDEAQRTTIAFSGLAMMTGNLEAQSFFPPGKVADYTGFQYLRDNDPDGMGHNTSFLTRVANNVIYILNDSQFAQLKTLATGQLAQIDLYGYKRFPLMKAFRRLLEGDVPSGSPGLNLEAVKTLSRELYVLDGQISFDRALLYAAILNSLDSTQKAYLAAMKGKGWSSWPDITNEQVSAKMRGLPQGTSVAVMTYASDLFSWYAGSVEADVYFCPERQGTYYGSFYIKDAPAIGHEGYSIDEALTATAGAALSDSSKGYVTPAQAALMSSLVDRQRANLYASSTFNIVGIRTEIATLLRTLLSPGTSSDAVKSRVLELSGIYGDLDGENNYAYATVFTQVFKTLSADQTIRMAALRKSIMSGTYSDGTPFDFSVCTAPFLYSSVITNVGVLSPYIADTDYLFQTGTAQTAPIVTWTTPESVVAGTALSVVQLNATANVPGTFVYTPSVGTVLVAGTQTLSVAFTPTDTTNYATATATVSIVVTTAGGESVFVGPRAGGGWSGAVSGSNLIYNGVTYPIVNGRVTFPDCTMFIVAPNGALMGGAIVGGCTPTGGSATGGSGTGGGTTGGSGTGGSSSGFVGPRDGGGWSGTISGSNLLYNNVTYPIVNGRVVFPDCTMFIVAPNGALMGGAIVSGCTPTGGGTGTSETGTGGSTTGGSGTGSGSETGGGTTGGVSGSGFAGPRSGGGWSGTISGSNLLYNSVTYPIVNGRVTFPDCTVFIVAPNGALLGGANIADCTPTGGSTGTSEAGTGGGATGGSGTGSSGGSGTAFVGPHNGGGWTGTISGSNLIYNNVTYPIVNGRVTFPDCTVFIVAPNGALVGGATIPNCVANDRLAADAATVFAGVDAR